MSERPLQGITALDITSGIAGPLCTKLLAWSGAEVIKVEEPGTGDPTRGWGPFPDDVPHPEKSGTFLYLNTGKKSITLDFACPTGHKLLLKLAGQADVLVEDMGPQAATRHGLTYEALATLNPRLILTSVSPFGQTGPYRDYKADDLVTFALSGSAYLHGDPSGSPILPGKYPASYLTGLSAFLGTLGALYGATESGTGQQVDVSALEAMGASMGQSVVQYSYTGTYQRRGQGQAGQGPLRCTDGYVNVHILLLYWPQVVKALGIEFAPGFQAPPTDRRITADELAPVLEQYIKPTVAKMTKLEFYRALQAQKIPTSYLATPRDMLESPQYRARGFWVEIDHPVVGKWTYPGAPYEVPSQPWPWSQAPLLGEHNAEVYCGSLGYSRDDLVRLRQSGII